MSSLKLRATAMDDIKSTADVAPTAAQEEAQAPPPLPPQSTVAPETIITTRTTTTTTATNIVSATSPTSHAAWWIKNPPKRWAWTLKQLQNQRQLKGRKQSFGQDMGDLCRNIALHGYDKLLSPELTWLERLIWLALHVTSMTAMLVVLSLMWEQFVAQYFVVNLHDPLYPVENVPFPAVSICSNNRISMRAAIEYAKELSAKDPKKRDPKYFVGRIKNFSRLYYRYTGTKMNDNSTKDLNEEDYMEFQSFLEEYATDANETFYDTRKIMRRLTPPCEKFILRCLLSGVEIECFSRTAFQEGLTPYGPCCTFNTEDSYVQRSPQNSFVLPDYGLTVVLNTSHSDDYSSILNIEGYGVVIHSPNDYPDVASSGSGDVFPTEGKESFVQIRSRLIGTDEALRSYSPESRKCYFDSEAPSKEVVLRSRYSFTNCITRCRIRSIRALCDCIPFYMPLNLTDTSNTLIYCSLQHVDCLLHYGFKWRNVLTQRLTIPELQREFEDSMYCPACLPACDDVQYQVSVRAMPLDRFRATSSYQHIKENLADLSNISVLRVHFKEPYTYYYKRVIGNAWFEAMSTIGNILSIFVGFSLVAIFEIFYFVFKYFRLAFAKCKVEDKERQHQKGKRNVGEKNRQLYIYP